MVTSSPGGATRCITVPESALAGPPRHIHIIGGPCSGKTRLAERLAPALGLPAFALDEVLGEVNQRLPHPIDEVERHGLLELKTAELAVQDAWITEGAYLSWAQALLDAAEVVVWMQVSWPVAEYRVLRRYLQQRLSGERVYPGARDLLEFCRGTFAFYRSSNGAHNSRSFATGLKPYGEKLVICRDDRDISNLMRRLKEPIAWA